MYPDLIISNTWQHHLAAYPISMYSHFIFGPLALFIGSFQLLVPLRTALPKLHKFIGYIYISSCFVAASAAMPLALNTTMGPIASAGLFTMAIAWLLTTGMATKALVDKDYRAHKCFMIRSYAVTYAGVTFRVLLGLGEAMNFSDQATYSFTTWACWISTLVASEIYLRAKKNDPTPPLRFLSRTTINLLW